jgi:O-antigen/teichoic acid export membrane protein
MMRDGVINYSSMVVSGLSGIILIPIYLKYLGAELYGLWLAAVATSSIFSALDFGLLLSVTKVVSSDSERQRDLETAGFVQAAGRVYFFLAVLAAFGIAFGGARLSTNLHLSPHGASLAPTVFGAVAVCFVGERLFTFSTSVLAGLRRFDVLNLFLTGTTFFRVIGTIIVLVIGGSILTVAGFCSLAALGSAVVSVMLVRRLRPDFRVFGGGSTWRSVRPQMSFGINTLLSTLLSKVVWDSAPLLTGFIRGSAAIVPLQVGQRLPLAVSDLNWRVAEVFFPAVGAQQQSGDLGGARALLEFGTRWSIVLTAPMCLILAMLAPEVLTAFVGNPQPESIWILRIMCCAIMVEGLGLGAHNLLLGRGAAGTICLMYAGFSIPMLASSIVLLKTIGVVGPAISLCFVLGLMSLLLLHIGSRRCETSVAAVIVTSTRGIYFPLAVAAVFTLSVARFCHPTGRLSVFATLISASFVYGACLYFCGGRKEERELIRNILRIPYSIARAFYFWLRELWAVPEYTVSQDGDEG